MRILIVLHSQNMSRLMSPSAAITASKSGGFLSEKHTTGNIPVIRRLFRVSELEELDKKSLVFCP